MKTIIAVLLLATMSAQAAELYDYSDRFGRNERRQYDALGPYDSRELEWEARRIQEDALRQLRQRELLNQQYRDHYNLYER